MDRQMIDSHLVNRERVFAIFKWFDNEFTQGNFELCNRYLSLVDPWMYDEDGLVALMTATYMARNHLPYRESFVKSCIPVLEQWMGTAEVAQLIEELL